MTNFFFWLYKIAKARSILSPVILFGLLALSAVAASTLSLEEDITTLMPRNEKVAQTGDVLQGFALNKRLVIHLYTPEEDQTDELIRIAGVLTDSLQRVQTSHVAEVRTHIPDDQIQRIYQHYLNNLPFYLEEADYKEIEAKITAEGIEQAVRQFHKSLLSPIGVVTKTLLVQDPFGFTTYPLNRTKRLQIEDNLTLYKNHILTQDKHHLIFFIELANPPNETHKNGELIDLLDKWSEAIGRAGNVTVEYFGTAAVSVANARRIKQDIYLTVTVALIGLFFFITFFYKDLTFFMAITPGLFGGLVAIAVLTLVRDKVSVISLAVGSVLLGITIDYALHFFTHAKKERDMQRLFRDLVTPLIMSSFTTASAFFSLLFIRSTALQDLGIFAGVSVLAACFFTLAVLPQTIRYKGSSSRKEKPNSVERLVNGLAGYPIYRKPVILILVALVSVVSLFTWRNVTFEKSMQRLSYVPDNLMTFEQHINEISNYSSHNIFVATTGKDFWAALEANKKLRNDLMEWQADSLIFHYTTLNEIIPTRSQQHERLNRWQAFWQKSNPNSVARGLGQEAVALGFKPGIFSRFDSLLVKDYKQISTKAVNELISVLGDDLQVKNPDGSVSVLTSIKLSADNKPVVLERLERREGLVILDRAYITSQLVALLKEDFNKLVGISLLVVFLIVWISYGRIELAIITFLPILISWLWVLGLMSLLGLTFNIINIIVCTFIFGLGVDYSIFVMRGLLQDHTLGLKNLISYKKSIILSTVTTLVGIGVLALARHPALTSIAFLAIIGIISVVLITFTVEHVAFNALIGNRKRKGQVPFTLPSLFVTIVAFLYFLLGCLILQLVRIAFRLPLGKNQTKKKFFHWLIMIFCRSLVYLMANFKKKIINRSLADFSKPSVIIANHHSFIDILILLMFDPRVVMVTNNWVYFSPFFGKPVQYADFILASRGIENQLDKLKDLVRQGYSIVVFPEGTRSGHFELRRFHKGAFYLAEHLQLDIQPVVLHGTSLVMPKGDDFYLKNNEVTVRFLPRIAHDDPEFGKGYKERSKGISKHFKATYDELRRRVETPDFFKEILFKNYVYKGPVVERPVRKTLQRPYLEWLNRQIPFSASVLIWDCDYGLSAYALGFSGPERTIKATDQNEEKVTIAAECPMKSPNVEFQIRQEIPYDFDRFDVILIDSAPGSQVDDEGGEQLAHIVAQQEVNCKMIIKKNQATTTLRAKLAKDNTTWVMESETQEAIMLIKK